MQRAVEVDVAGVNSAGFAGAHSRRMPNHSAQWATLLRETGANPCSVCNATTRTRPGAKFCVECASPFPRRCPACASEAPASAKFCPECAAPLTAKFPTAAPAPGASLSKRLTDKILQSKSALEGERKRADRAVRCRVHFRAGDLSGAGVCLQARADARGGLQNATRRSAAAAPCGDGACADGHRGAEGRGACGADRPPLGS